MAEESQGFKPALKPDQGADTRLLQGPYRLRVMARLFHIICLAGLMSLIIMLGVGTVAGTGRALESSKITPAGVGATDYAPGPAYNVKSYGARGDGQTDDTLAIQAGITAAVGGTLIIPAGTYLISRTIFIPANTHIQNYGKFVSNLPPEKMPPEFFLIKGSNVVIDGLRFSLANERSVPRSGAGNCLTLGDNISGIIIKNCDLRYFWHCIRAEGRLEGVKILNNKFVGVYMDVYIAGNKVHGKDILIENNEFLIHRNWSVPVVNGGAIHLGGGLAANITAKPTDAIYENYFLENVVIRNNYIFKVDGRPIRCHNCKKIIVDKNFIKGELGDTKAVGVSDDVIDLTLCREFQVINNKIDAGGENAIDILSSQNGLVAANTITRADDGGIALGVTDWYLVYPHITLSKKYLNCCYVECRDNVIEAAVPIFIVLGDNLRFSGNHLKIWNLFSSRARNTGALVYLSTIPIKLIKENRELVPKHIVFSGNKVEQGERYAFTARAATGSLITTREHDLVTGEPVEIDTGGISHIVKLPGGLNYHSIYWIIRVSDTELKLAASRQEAFAGKALTIQTDGGGPGQILYLVRTIQYRIIRSPGFLEVADPETLYLQEELANQAVVLFSKIATVTQPQYLGVRKNIRVEYILDPAVDYGAPRDELPKYAKLPPYYRKGADSFGLAVTQQTATSTTFFKGTKIWERPGTPDDGYLRIKWW